MGLMYVHSFNQGMYIYHPIEANHYAGIRWQGDVLLYSISNNTFDLLDILHNLPLLFYCCVVKVSAVLIYSM